MYDTLNQVLYKGILTNSKNIILDNLKNKIK